MTVIELLVVIAIVGLLSTAVFVRLELSREKARDAVRLGNINHISKALKVYQSGRLQYPSSVGCQGVPLTDTCTSDSGQSPWISDLAGEVNFLPVDPIQLEGLIYLYQSFYPEIGYCADEEGVEGCFNLVSVHKQDIEGANLPHSPYILCFRLETVSPVMEEAYQVESDKYCVGDWGENN